MRREYLIPILVCAVIVALCLPAVLSASEVSWISGTGGPESWAVEPNAPTVYDEVLFSGPTNVYLNKCLAESQLGGKPKITIDRINKQIQLTFVPPATTGCSELLEPVCGLIGSLGRLETGQWQFSGKCDGTSFSILFSVISEQVSAAYYVDANAKGKNDGTSWTDAFNYLQDALAEATSNSLIRVAQGVYNPDRGAEVAQGDLSAAFHLTTQVTIKGGYAGLLRTDPNVRDTEVYETVLSGDLQGDDAAMTSLFGLFSDASRADNCYHVLVVEGPNTTAVLDGLTIYGGNAKGSSDDRYDYGGGIYNDQGSLIVTDCVLTGNSAWSSGGAIYNNGGSSLSLTDSTISGNYACVSGGAVYQGPSATVTANKCAISANSARYYGGAIFCNVAGNTSLSNCVLIGNQAIDTTYGKGGAICNFAGAVQMDNCTLTGNLASAGSSIACNSLGMPAQTSVLLDNCILWSKSDEIWNSGDPIITISYSNVWGGWTGQGNLDTDPCFIEQGHWESGVASDLYDDIWVEGNYHLWGSSPCIDTGDPNFTSDATDMDGNPRVRGLAVDMGAFEIKDDRPIADAGPNQSSFAWAGAAAHITLDGSGSHDPELMPLEYIWYRDGKQVGDEASLAVDLTPGEYTFQLVVNDGHQNSEPDSVTVSIANVAPATVTIVPSQIATNSSQSKILAMVSLPAGVTKKDFDNSRKLILYPGTLSATAQTVATWLGGKTLITASFSKSQLLKAVSGKGQKELQVVGQLKSGQYFWASTTVTIK